MRWKRSISLPLIYPAYICGAMEEDIDRNQVDRWENKHVFHGYSAEPQETVNYTNVVKQVHFLASDGRFLYC
jgi:hypothetical protein